MHFEAAIEHKLYSAGHIYHVLHSDLRSFRQILPVGEISQHAVRSRPLLCNSQSFSQKRGQLALKIYLELNIYGTFMLTVCKSALFSRHIQGQLWQHFFFFLLQMQPHTALDSELLRLEMNQLL